MYRRILVPLDGSRYSDHALPYAVSIAARTGATIELVHVHHHHELDPNLAALPQYQYQHIAERDIEHDDDCLKWEREHLEEKAADMELRYGINVRTRMLIGNTAQALTREASEIVADLIVMATHAREGIERIRFGDVAHELIEHLNVPALCVRPQHDQAPLQARELKSVLIPLDGSTFSEQILDVAAPLVQALGAHATLIHIVGTRQLFSPGIELGARNGFPTREQAMEYLRDVAERYQEKLPYFAVSAVEAVESSTAIVQLLEPGDFDLVAMATHGRSGLSRLLLGSVAEKVVRRTFRPVLLYRPRTVRLPADKLEEAFKIYGD